MVDLAAGPQAAAEAARAEGANGDKAGDGQSPLKIALFSLGNLCTHRECRERLLAQGFEQKIAAMAGRSAGSGRTSFCDSGDESQLRKNSSSLSLDEGNLLLLFISLPAQ